MNLNLLPSNYKSKFLGKIKYFMNHLIEILSSLNKYKIIQFLLRNRFVALVILSELYVVLFQKHNQLLVGILVILVSTCTTWHCFSKNKLKLLFPSWILLIIINGASLYFAIGEVNLYFKGLNIVYFLVLSTIGLCIPECILLNRFLRTYDNHDIEIFKSKFDYYKSLTGFAAFCLTFFNFYVALYAKSSIAFGGIAEVMGICLYPSTAIFLFGDIFIKREAIKSKITSS